MSAGMTATIIGITAGFVTLIGLYLWLVGHDATSGIVMLAIAPSLLALMPVATRRKSCPRR